MGISPYAFKAGIGDTNDLKVMIVQEDGTPEFMIHSGSVFTLDPTAPQEQPEEEWYYGQTPETETTSVVLNRIFTVSGVSVTPSLGATYTNNTKTFTVLATSIVAGTGTLYCSATGAPQSSGTLTQATGTGTTPLTFTSVTTDPCQTLTLAKDIQDYTPLSATYGGTSLLYVPNILQTDQLPVKLSSDRKTLEVTLLCPKTIIGTPVTNLINLSNNQSCTYTQNGNTFTITSNIHLGDTVELSYIAVDTFTRTASNTLMVCLSTNHTLTVTYQAKSRTPDWKTVAIPDGFRGGFLFYGPEKTYDTTLLASINLNRLCVSGPLYTYTQDGDAYFFPVLIYGNLIDEEGNPVQNYSYDIQFVDALAVTKLASTPTDSPYPQTTDASGQVSFYLSQEILSGFDDISFTPTTVNVVPAGDTTILSTLTLDWQQFAQGVAPVSFCLRKNLSDGTMNIVSWSETPTGRITPTSITTATLTHPNGSPDAALDTGLSAVTGEQGPAPLYRTVFPLPQKTDTVTLTHYQNLETVSTLGGLQ